MKKRRQHHVWKHYLEPWTNNRQIWCLQDRTKIFKTNALNVVVESDFYKLNRLNADDFSIIDSLIRQSPSQSAEALRGLVRNFDVWHEIKDLLMPSDPRNKAVLQHVEEQVINAEEDYHSAIETAAAPIMHELRSGNTESLRDDEKMMTFCHFLALQWLRTRAIKRQFLDDFRQRTGFDASRSWNIVSHIYAANVGCSLFVLRKQNTPHLITNKTELPLLTGDQPIINLKQAQNIGEAPKHLALYYPLSPSYALFVDDAEAPLELGRAFTSREEVATINDRMVATSHFQAFGATRECLVPYLLPRPR